MIRLALVSVALVVVSSASRSARADDNKMQCVRSYEDAQKLRQEGKLRASRTELVKCTSESCPPSLRKDCGPWLREVDDALPSVVLGARGADGRDLIEVRVFFDGAPLVEQIDGRAVPIDPGVHVFRFEASGLTPVEERVVVREGQKLRSVQITFAAAQPAAPPPPSSTTSPPEAPPDPSRPVPATSYALGGVGLVALGGFAYFALDGLSKKSDLDRCRPSCQASDVDAAKRSFLVGDVSLAVGVVALGAAAYFFFTRPIAGPSAGSASAAGVTRIDIGVVHGGAVAAVRGSF